jgi:hypothetical protein
VSLAQTHTWFGDVELDAAGDAYVAWYEPVTGNGIEGIYVAKCTFESGCTLVGRGRLEGTLGDTRATTPRLTVDGERRPIVTWTEESAVDGEIVVHVWRYNGDPDSE